MDKVYDKAWKLIASPERWTKGRCARNVNDERCSAQDLKAVKWCAVGAIIKIYGVDSLLATRVFESMSLAAWNDNPIRKHQDVVELLKDWDI